MCGHQLLSSSNVYHLLLFSFFGQKFLPSGNSAWPSFAALDTVAGWREAVKAPQTLYASSGGEKKWVGSGGGSWKGGRIESLAD